MSFLLRGLFALVALLILALLVVTLLRIPLDMSRYKPMAEETLSEALGRRVNIDGKVVVTTSLWPYFELEGLHIANPTEFPEGDFALMEKARVSVGLLPLLQRRLEIREFHVSGLNLDLVRNADGAANWVFEQSAPDAEPAQDPNTDKPRNQAVRTAILSVNALELENIQISFHDRDKDPWSLPWTVPWVALHWVSPWSCPCWAFCWRSHSR